MAVSNTSVTDTYNTLLTTTMSKYMPKMVDNIFQGVPLLWWLNDKKRKRPQRGGYDIRIPVAYGENTTPMHFSGYDIVDITPQEGLTMLVYNWKSFAGSLSINQEEELKNQGQFKLLDLLGWKVDQLERSMRWYLNDELHGIFGSGAKTYTGGETHDTSGTAVDSVGGLKVDTGYKSFNSLDHIVRSAWGIIDPASTGVTTHTVGGVQVSTTSDAGGSAYVKWGGVDLTAYTNLWWANQTNPGFGLLNRGGVGGVVGPRLSPDELMWAGNCNNQITGAPLYSNLIFAMLEMYTRLSDEGDNPDLILTSPEVYNLYEMSQIPNERYTDRRIADAGFENIKFKGCTMLADHGIQTKLATSGHSATAPAVPMYMLNSDYLWWVVHPDADFKQTPFTKPEDQLARTAQVVLMAQLCCDNRRKQGHISLGSIATYGWNVAS